ncbi:MAG: hypothetical protein WCE21_02380 [Candidatus Babeliales bacterium]
MKYILSLALLIISAWNGVTFGMEEGLDAPPAKKQKISAAVITNTPHVIQPLSLMQYSLLGIIGRTSYSSQDLCSSNNPATAGKKVTVPQATLIDCIYEDHKDDKAALTKNLHLLFKNLSQVGSKRLNKEIVITPTTIAQAVFMYDKYEHNRYKKPVREALLSWSTARRNELLAIPANTTGQNLQKVLTYTDSIHNQINAVYTEHCKNIAVQGMATFFCEGAECMSYDKLFQKATKRDFSDLSLQTYTSVIHNWFHAYSKHEDRLQQTPDDYEEQVKAAVEKNIKENLQDYPEEAMIVQDIVYPVIEDIVHEQAEEENQ